jgi:predicted phage terminase large subunit-like protein
MIDLGHNKKESKRFMTLEFGTLGSSLAGRVRAMNLLYCDDLVDGIEAALSRDRMDKLWQQYYTDLRQRKIGDRCKELHIATRWSVNDVLGRLDLEYSGDEFSRFITCPALDENDESNFDYAYGVGFSTKFYHEQRDIMDDVNWRALYMQQPIDREGRLYDPDELRRYFELPEGQPDAIISVCDTKDRGSDDCVMPVAYRYGDNYYIEEIFCDNSKPEVVDELLIQCLLRHKVQMSCFESNSAGGRVAQTVQAGVKARGGITKIETRYTTQNKETKILANSPWVKERCLFKDDTVSDKNYKKALNKLCGYSVSSKNKHDDVPDAFSQLALYAESMGGAKVKVIPRIF